MRIFIAFLVAAFASVATAAAPYPVWVDAPNGLAKVNAPLTLANGTISLPAAGAAASGYVTTGAQTIAGAKTLSGNTAIGGTLGVTGASTLASVGVTGAATVGTTLNVTGASTLASVGVTGAATVGTTLGVTGKLTATTWIASASSHTLTTWWLNAAAATGACPVTGTGCVGHVLPAQAFTVTGITGYASVASGGGAANTVITVTDGTNTCTVTIPCNSAPPDGTSTAGLVRVSGVAGVGTGCVYAASAAITASITTAGCTATQPTFKNLDLVGKWQ
jgi:hypothetical protein